MHDLPAGDQGNWAGSWRQVPSRMCRVWAQAMVHVPRHSRWCSQGAGPLVRRLRDLPPSRRSRWMRGPMSAVVAYLLEPSWDPRSPVHRAMPDGTGWQFPEDGKPDVLALSDTKLFFPDFDMASERLLWARSERQILWGRSWRWVLICVRFTSAFPSLSKCNTATFI